MSRSLTNRRFPRWLSLLLSALLALYWVPALAVNSASADAGGFAAEAFDQCANGTGTATNCADGWTNGALNAQNSHYREDQAVPQRLVATFAAAGEHTITLTYLAREKEHHAYDSLATWNRTVTEADRCQMLPQGAPCVGGSASTFDIPADPTVVGTIDATATSGHQLNNQVMTMYGGTLTGISVPTHSSPTSGTSDLAQTVVSFTTAQDGDAVMLLFGGHLAAASGPRGWGSGLGASAISGSPYHIKWTATDGKNVSSRDNQIQAGAILPVAGSAIATSATPSVAIGSPISDTATVLPSTALGSVTFKAYGPDDRTCSGAPVFTSETVAVSGGTASATFSPVQVGAYRWVASFASADSAKWASASGQCNDEGETSVVTKLQPTITTAANTSASLPGAMVGDVATIGNLTPDATGTVTFTLYADSACTAPAIFTDQKPLGQVSASQARVSSDEHEVSVAGTYYWVASYSGDAKNEPVAGSCGDPGETSTVGKTPVYLSTISTADAFIGADHTDVISDQATVTWPEGRPAPAGSVTFKLYGPFDQAPLSCVGLDPAWTQTVAITDQMLVTAGGSSLLVPSPTFTPTQVGIYRWAATYSGDGNYSEAVEPCTAEYEESRVSAPTVEKSAVPATGSTVPASATITYTIKVTNDGAATVTDEPVVDQLPASVSYNNDASPVADYDSKAGTLTWTVDLDPGQSNFFTYSVTVNGETPAGVDLENVATFFGHEARTVHHVGAPGPGIDKSSPTEGETVPQGATIHYIVTVSNSGNVLINDRPVLDTLPTGVIYQTGTATTNGAAAEPTISGQQLTWTVDVPAKSSVKIEYDVTVDAGTCSCQQLVNTAVFEGLQDSTTHTVGVPLPTLSKSANPVSGSVVQPGQEITYTVTVANKGNYPITDDVSDQLPAHVTYKSVAAGTPAPTYDASTNTLTWSAVTLAAGATQTFVYTVTVDDNVGAGVNLANHATFAGLSAETSHHTGAPGPGLDKTATPASGSTVHRNDLITYTVSVSNTGDFPVSGPVVDTLPGHVTVVADSISGGGVPNAESTTITWNVTLAAGASATYTYKVKVDGDAPAGTPLLNTAAFQQLIRSTTHTVVVPVTPPPPTPSTPTLSVAKSVDKPVAQFGDTLTYTLKATVGPAAGVSSATVTDVVPAGTTYVAGSAACDPGTCTVSYDASTRALTWALGDLAAGTSRTVRFKAVIDTPIAGAGGAIPAVRILNVGAVESVQTPKAPSNEVRTEVVAVQGVKIVKPPTVTTGGSALPRTGPAVPLLPLTGAAVLMIGLGVALTAAVRRRER